MSIASLSTSSRVRRRARDDSFLSCSREQALRAGWDKVINWTLIEWGTRPGQFDDDDVMPPTPAALNAAVQEASEMRDDGEMPVPDWVVPTGDGGIAFRWGNPLDVLRSLEFAGSGEVWFEEIEDCGTPTRYRVTPPHDIE
jgi:hypothetical protein